MPFSLTKKCTLSVLIALLVATGPAWADKPDWKDNKKMDNPLDWQKKKNKQLPDRLDPDQSRSNKLTAGIHFNDRHRDVIRQYYSDSFRAGHCPPGLSKKNNGCLPPGQAKKWHLGRPLPGDVVYYDLPPQVIIGLGTPPAGQKYVRVASDFLLIPIGTVLVLDAIQDLNRL